MPGKGWKPIISVVWERKTLPKEAVCLYIEKWGGRQNEDCDEEIDNTAEAIDLSSGIGQRLVLSCPCTINVLAGQIVVWKWCKSKWITKYFLVCNMTQDVFVERSGGRKSQIGDEISSASTGRFFLFEIQKEHIRPLQRIVVKKWSFYVTYDGNLGVFVLVSKVDGKLVKCYLCRSNACRRGLCEQELSCLNRSSMEL